MRANRKLPRYYYTATLPDGSLQMSRIGADSDKEGVGKIKALVGPLQKGLRIWRNEGVGSSLPDKLVLEV